MKILYVTTVSATMGFFPAHIRMLQDAGHTVELACNLNDPLPEKVEELGCTAHHIPFSRSPLSGENVKAYRELKKLLVGRYYDIDIFEVDGVHYISEVNPRFGGGYPHAFESGANHTQFILNNLNGIANKVQVGNYQEGIIMMKYSEVGIV